MNVVLALSEHRMEIVWISLTAMRKKIEELNQDLFTFADYIPRHSCYHRRQMTIFFNDPYRSLITYQHY